MQYFYDSAQYFNYKDINFVTIKTLNISKWLIDSQMWVFHALCTVTMSLTYAVYTVYTVGMGETLDSVDMSGL